MQKHLQLINHLIDKIEENLAEEINIVDLAKSFHLSPWHFQRLFKSLVGDSLGGYIRGRRLSKAAEVLLNTNQGIIDIALSVGFNSHEAFTRSFKSIFKLTPKEFREEKPSFSIYQKPLLTSDLLTHIQAGVDKEPQILDMLETTIVGCEAEVPSPFLIEGQFCNYMAPSWFGFFDRQKAIQNIIPHFYYGMFLSPSGDFTEENLNYIAGVPVSSLGDLPPGCSVLQLPKQKVAMFKTHRAIDADHVTQTVDYIYGYWLPNSPYDRGSGNDFEIFKTLTDLTDPNLETLYVIPIIAKK